MTGHDVATAFVSGRAGRAIVCTPDNCFFLITIDAEAPLKCDATHWSHLRNLHPDTETVEAGEYPFLEARETLRQRWEADRALRLLLVTLDETHSDKIRAQACRAIHPLLENDRTLAAVYSRLLSAPLPDSADFAGASRIATDAGFDRALALYDEINAACSTARDVLAHWQSTLKALADPMQRFAASEMMTRLDGIARLASIEYVEAGVGPLIATTAFWGDASSGDWVLGNLTQTWLRETFVPAWLTATNGAELPDWLRLHTKAIDSSSPHLQPGPQENQDAMRLREALTRAAGNDARFAAALAPLSRQEVRKKLLDYAASIPKKRG